MNAVGTLFSFGFDQNDLKCRCRRTDGAANENDKKKQTKNAKNDDTKVIWKSSLIHLTHPRQPSMKYILYLLLLLGEVGIILASNTDRFRGVAEY